MRITSGMVRRNYQNGLMEAQARMQAANMTNTNYQKFQKVSEDTVSASKAFQVRRELARAETYEATAKDLQGRMKTADDSVLSIQTKLTSVYEKTIAAVNGTMSPDEHKIYAEELRGLQKAILQDFNTSYAGQQLFGGTGAGNVPLTVDDDGKLLYRGYPVDGPVLAELPPDVTTPADIEAFRKQELETYNKQMEALRNETILVDFGYGINADNAQSGLNISQPALDFLGYGTNEDTGLPNNLYSLIGKMADYLETSGDNFDATEFGKFQGQFDDARNNFLTRMTNLGNKSETLNYNLTRLSSSIASLKEKQTYVETVDPALAIMNFEYQQFAYKSALAIGTQVLQPTLLDYLK